MKCLTRSIVPAATLAGMLLFTACDWSSGSQENFNTSGGSANVNISGFYRGANGGRMVANTSNGNINSMTIQQSGNTVQIVDNQGSTYKGTIGAPLVSDDLTDGSIAPGAIAATYQISFSGKDGVAARDINFTGVLTILTVTDIVAIDRSSSSDQTRSSATNSVFAPTDPLDTGTGTSTDTTDDRTASSATSYTYSLSGPTSQLQLEGTWSEVGGVTSSVFGYGPPAQGNIVVAGP